MTEPILADLAVRDTECRPLDKAAILRSMEQPFYAHELRGIG